MADPTLESNKSIATGLFLDVFDRHDLDAADAYLAPDVVFHNAGAKVRGIDGWKAFAAEWLTGFPNLSVSIDFVMAEDDRVLFHWRASATHSGVFRSRAASGRRVTASGLSLLRVSDGKIQEIWDETEAFGEFQALAIT